MPQPPELSAPAGSFESVQAACDHGADAVYIGIGRYNLRALPVVDKDKKPIGVITVGMILSKIEERTQTDEII